MSLHVALQSVLFYVLSCSTCAKINHRRKAKVKAKQEREEKLKLEMEQPGLYRHPSPFSTNPYWGEDIQMGPSLQRSKGGSKNASQRALTSAGAESSTASSTQLGNSPTILPQDEALAGDDWNRKRYQREDEELWGIDIAQTGHKFMDAIVKAGSSTKHMIEARLNKIPGVKEEPTKDYFSARNPPVNDLHPPVVSTKPSHRDATKWMLQPPPPAKIMEGKERVSRSGSLASNTSSRRGPDGGNLSRQVTERMVEAKLRRGENPSDADMASLYYPGSASRTPNSMRPVRSRTQRSRSLSEDSSSSEGGLKRSRRPPPLSLSPEYDMGPDGVMPADLKNRLKREQQRLSTITSSPARETLEKEDDSTVPAKSPLQDVTQSANQLPKAEPDESSLAKAQPIELGENSNLKENAPIEQ